MIGLVSILRGGCQKPGFGTASGKFVALDTHTNSFPAQGEPGSCGVCVLCAELERGAMASTNTKHHLDSPPRGAALCQSHQSSKTGKRDVSFLGSPGEIALDIPINSLLP